jgi:membrane protein implicated in regulation of membrane protease activity
MAALLPSPNLWAYFAATFVATLFALAVFAPNLNGATLIILSVIASLLISPFVQRHWRESSKAKPQYRNLARELDEQLAALEIERTRQGL